MFSGTDHILQYSSLFHHDQDKLCTTQPEEYHHHYYYYTWFVVCCVYDREGGLIQTKKWKIGVITKRERHHAQHLHT